MPHTQPQSSCNGVSNSVFDVAGDVDLVALQTHHLKLQQFIVEWGSQQDQLLTVGIAQHEIARTPFHVSLENVQIQLEEAVPKRDELFDVASLFVADATGPAEVHPSFAEDAKGLDVTDSQAQAAEDLRKAAKRARDSKASTASTKSHIRFAVEDEAWCSDRSDKSEPTNKRTSERSGRGTSVMSDMTGVDTGSAQRRKEESGVDISRSMAAQHIRKSNEKKENFLKRCMHKLNFESVCATVILTNAVIIGMAADYAMEHPNEEHSVTLTTLETVFAYFYLFELIMRLCSQGRGFFTDKKEVNWNMFDLALVIHGMWEQLEKLWADSSRRGISNLRLFRILKMAKVLRVLRILRMFRELRLIMNSLLSCCISLMWASIIVIMISYVFGVALLQACSSYLQAEGDDVDEKTRRGIERYWSSIGQSILTLYMSTMGGGNCSIIAEPLWETGVAFYGVYLAYLAVFHFVVVNIISSIFLESILTSAAKDQQLMIETQMEKKGDYISSLGKFYEDMDSNGDGEITFAEFCEHLHCPRMQAFAASLDIDIMDARQFFEVLSERGKCPVDLESFVVGCIKMKGAARSLDLMDLAHTQKKAHKTQHLENKRLHKMVVEQGLSQQSMAEEVDKLTQYMKQLAALQIAATRTASLQNGGSCCNKAVHCSPSPTAVRAQAPPFSSSSLQL